MALFSQCYSNVDNNEQGRKGKTAQELAEYLCEESTAPVFVLGTKGASLLGLSNKTLTKTQCVNLFELCALDNHLETLKDANGKEVTMSRGREKSMVSEIIIGCSKSISIISAFDHRIADMFRAKLNNIGQYLEKYYAAHANGQIGRAHV